MTDEDQLLVLFCIPLPSLYPLVLAHHHHAIHTRTSFERIEFSILNLFSASHDE